MNIVCLAGCDWTATWQPTQEIMTRLAEQGHRILYVDPTGTRTLGWSDWQRVWHRLKAKWFHSYPTTAYRGYGLREEVLRIQHHEHITLYHPLMLPFPCSRLATNINWMIVNERLKKWLSGGTLDVVWCWFPSPLNASLMGGWKILHPSVMAIYQIMSTITAVRGHIMHAAELDMLNRAALVFVNSDGLKKQVQARSANVHLFRAGVDTTLFDPTNPKWIGGYSKERPHDLPTGKPLIGYVGAIHEWFDADLWLALMNRLPQYDFVEITKKSHSVLPLYIHYFDVCVIPYRRTAYTETSFPAKLHEYLAMGKPVVATRTAELEAYEKETGINLLLSTGVDEWMVNIKKAVEHRMPEQKHQRRFAAIQHDYSPMVDRMLVLINEQRPA